MKRTPLRRVSKKRRTQLKVYSVLRKEYLLAHPICEVCKKVASSQLHHCDGREHGRLIVTEHWLAVCPKCHSRIHQHPGWARLSGFME